MYELTSNIQEALVPSEDPSQPPLDTQNNAAEQNENEEEQSEPKRPKNIDESISDNPTFPLISLNIYPLERHRNIPVEYDIDSHCDGHRSCRNFFATESMYILEQKHKMTHPIPYINTIQVRVSHQMTHKHRVSMLAWIYNIYMNKLSTKKAYGDLFDSPQLAINYLDRYLGKVPTEIKRLPTITYACLICAMKMEEIELNFPNFHGLPDNITSEMIAEAEMDIINVLEGELDVPSISIFIKRYLQLLDMHNSEICKHIAHFLGNLFLTDYDSINFYYTVMAAAVVFWVYCKSKDLELTKENYPEIMVIHTELEYKDISDALVKIDSLFKNTKKIYNKNDDFNIKKADQNFLCSLLYRYYLNTSGSAILKACNHP